MDILSSILLGIIQGITEFLPISSSGHLIVARDILNLNIEYGLAFDAVLQLATTLAVLVYFWKDLSNIFLNFLKWISNKEIGEKDKTILISVIIGTIPALILGLILENIMDTVFRNSYLVSISLIFGAILMFLSEKFAKQNKSLTKRKGLAIGLFQALALIPGMSRSGMSISGGLFLGLTREEATRFSFILAFPILFGSGLKKLLDLGTNGILESVGISLLLGSLTSFIVGLFVVHVLIKYLKRHTLNIFVVYRVLIAFLILFI